MLYYLLLLSSLLWSTEDRDFSCAFTRVKCAYGYLEWKVTDDVLARAPEYMRPFLLSKALSFKTTFLNKRELFEPEKLVFLSHSEDWPHYCHWKKESRCVDGIWFHKLVLEKAPQKHCDMTASSLVKNPALSPIQKIITPEEFLNFKTFMPKIAFYIDQESCLTKRSFFSFIFHKLRRDWKPLPVGLRKFQDLCGEHPPIVVVTTDPQSMDCAVQGSWSRKAFVFSPKEILSDRGELPVVLYATKPQMRSRPSRRIELPKESFFSRSFQERKVYITIYETPKCSCEYHKGFSGFWA